MARRLCYEQVAVDTATLESPGHLPLPSLPFTGKCSTSSHVDSIAICNYIQWTQQVQ